MVAFSFIIAVHLLRLINVIHHLPLFLLFHWLASASPLLLLSLSSSVSLQLFFFCLIKRKRKHSGIRDDKLVTWFATVMTKGHTYSYLHLVLLQM